MGWTIHARRAGKALAAGLLCYTGARRVLARASRFAAGGRRVLVLSYHRVVEDFEAESERAIPGLLIDRRTFARQLEDLASAGYWFMSLSEAIEVLSGRRRPRRDVAVVTFDDGYRDVYDHALPLLQRKGIPAVVYLATGYVGTDRRFAHDRLYHLLRLALSGETRHGRNVLAGYSSSAWAASAVDQLIATRTSGQLERMIANLESGLETGVSLQPPSGAVLDWSMVRALADGGFEIGAHTVNHVVLTHEDEAGIEREIAGCRSDILQHVGRAPVHFAYPNGYYDRRVVGALVRHDFRSAATTEDLPNRVGADPFRLKRKTLWEDFSQGPFGYSRALTACHLDDVFGLLALTRPVLGERARPPETGSPPALGTQPLA